VSWGPAALRVPAAWVLAGPFLWLSRPSAASLAAGASLAGVGLLVRAWAAGCVHKDRVLAVSGPYAHTRNPLYLGSLILGTGVVIAGGRGWFLVVFLVFFALVYPRVMREEEERLERAFGPVFREYRAAVPRMLPRVTPFAGGGEGRDVSHGTPGGFSVRRYLDNREWHAALGTSVAFTVLLVKMLLA